MIKLVLLDIDGVLTDNGVYVDNNGSTSYRFSKRDGKGLELLLQAEIEVVLITSEKYHEGIDKRFKNIGDGRIGYHYDVRDKLNYYKVNFKPFQRDGGVAFMGDDIQDIGLLQFVSFPCCPSDAHSFVRGVQGIRVMKKEGGHGAVREMIDLVLKVNQWERERYEE